MTELTLQVSELTYVKTKAVFGDALGLLKQILIVPSAADADFELASGIEADSLREFLKSYCLRIIGLNYVASDMTQLKNDVNIFDALPDGTNATKKLKVAAARRNTAFTQDLYTLKTDFLLANTTAIYLDIVNGITDIDLTLIIGEIIPYGSYADSIRITQVSSTY